MLCIIMLCIRMLCIIMQCIMMHSIMMHSIMTHGIMMHSIVMHIIMVHNIMCHYGEVGSTGRCYCCVVVLDDARYTGGTQRRVNHVGYGPIPSCIVTDSWVGITVSATEGCLITMTSRRRCTAGRPAVHGQVSRWHVTLWGMVVVVGDPESDST